MFFSRSKAQLNICFFGVVLILLLPHVVTASSQPYLLPRSTSYNQPLHLRDSSDTSGNTTWAVTCVYPVSGIYAKLQRILLYLAMIVTFCLRFHDWLTAAGVAFIVTLSSTAAIHAIIISSQRNVGLDLDYIALENIVSRSIVGSMVFALYSVKILNSNPMKLFNVWNILLFISLMCIIANRARFLNGMADMATVVTCGDDWNCDDMCTGVASLALFRTANDQMAPLFLDLWTIYNDLQMTGNSTNIGDSSASGIMKSGETYQDPTYVTFIIIVAILGNLILRKSTINLISLPRDSRNWVFRHFSYSRKSIECGLTKKRLLLAKILVVLYYFWQGLVFFFWPLIPVDLLLIFAVQKYDPLGQKLGWIFQGTGVKPKPSKPRLWIAKFMALVCYCWTIFACLLFPGLFIFLAMQSEIVLSWLPESESPQAVGQWSPWVSVALAFVASIVSKFFSSSKNSPEPPKSIISLNSLDLLPTSERGPGKQSSRLQKFIGRMKWEFTVLFEEEWKNLKQWWRDPVKESWLDEGTKGLDRETCFFAYCKHKHSSTASVEGLLQEVYEQQKGVRREWQTGMPRYEAPKDPSNCEQESQFLINQLNHCCEDGFDEEKFNTALEKLKEKMVVDKVLEVTF